MRGPGRGRASAPAGAALTVLVLATAAACAHPASGGARVSSSGSVPAGTPRAQPGAVGAAGDLTYGSLPSWLPTPTVAVGQVLTASAAHPALGIEGDTVRIAVPGGQVVVTAVGPAVRASGRVPVPSSTRCTFTVTLIGAGGVVAVGAGRWTVIDERGRVQVPRVVRAIGTPWAATVTTGQTVRYALVADLPAGSGALAWAPSPGQVIATWDFDVEID